MKKYYQLYVAAAATLLVASILPALASAEVSADATVNVSTSAARPPLTNVGTVTNSDPKPLPPIPANLPPEIRAKLELAEKNRMMALEKTRAGMMASTTRPGVMLRTEVRADVKDARQDMRPGSTTRPLPPIMTALMKKMASTTMMNGESLGDRLKEYRQDVKETRLDVFAAKQNRIVEELTRALDNLKQIRTRISARIDKETAAGRDLTEAKRLLVTADAKLAAAGVAVQALASYTPPSAQTSAVIEASSTVDIAKPRQIGADAIKAVNDAKKALNDVVRSIAKASGLKVGADADVNASTTTQ